MYILGLSNDMANAVAVTVGKEIRRDFAKV